MNSREIEIVCIAIVAMFGIVAAARAEQSAVPKRFNAYIGGFAAPSYRVESRGDVVRYTALDRQRNSKRTTLKPTAVQWRAFRRTLDDLNVWNWQSRYFNERVVDGTQWSLDVAYSDRELKAHGENSYPQIDGGPNDEPRPTETFRRYLSAVQALIGGKRFE